MEWVGKKSESWVKRVELAEARAEAAEKKSEEAQERARKAEDSMVEMKEKLRQLEELMKAMGDTGLYEAIERKEKMRAVVVTGMPEAEYPSTAACIWEDERRMGALLDATGIQARPSALYRMPAVRHPGQRNPRPLKLLLPTSQHRNLLLARSHELRAQFPSIGIRPSVSPQHRNWTSIAASRGSNGTGVGYGRPPAPLTTHSLGPPRNYQSAMQTPSANIGPHAHASRRNHRLHSTTAFPPLTTSSFRKSPIITGR